MTASSVTGLYLNGVGSVDGSNKGSERMTLHSSHLLGPRIAAAGTVVLSSNAATVKFPQPLAGSETKYAVMLTVEAASGASHEVSVTAKTDDSDGNFASFGVAGVGATDNVMWTVVYHG